MTYHHHPLLLLFVTAIFFATNVVSELSGEEMTQVWVVRGAQVDLPCAPQPKVEGDQPVLVLWYRASNTVPIYSYDARVGEFNYGIRWADEEALGGRAYFTVQADPPKLVVQPAHAHDQGIYTCRVDYRVSTSTTSRLNLTVVIPPGPPMVLWKGKSVVGAVGPLREGESVELRCRSVGGRPTPILTWWWSGQRLPLESVNSTTDPVSGTYSVEATLSMEATRELEGETLTCHALTPTDPRAPESTSIVQARTAAVSLNITLPPVEVKILGSGSPITSGTTLRLVCRVVGSHPPAQLTWWRGHSPLSQVTYSIADAGNITTATLTVVVSRQHDGASLRCSGVNPALPHAPLTDSTKLSVYYTPVVGLSLGRALDPKSIKEGDDVYFECNIEANPPFHRIDWYHNGEELVHNMSAGVVMSGLSLILRGLQREHSGSYTCAAANLEGRVTSNAVHLTVRHSPVCAGSGLDRTQGAARGSPAVVKCTVEAEPSRGITWEWVRIREDGTEERINQEEIRNDGLTSSISVTPQTPQDYGRILCEATNAVGSQKMPCMVTLVPAGPPDTPTNCSATPTTHQYKDKAALTINCLEGFDGGLPQHFLMEAWQEGAVVANMTSEFPEWMLDGLTAGVGVNIQVTAHNVRGKSKALVMEVHTTSAQQHAAPGDYESMIDIPPLLGVIAGVIVVLMILLLVGVIVVKRVRPRRPEKPISDIALTPTTGDAFDPDVVASIQRRPPSIDVLPGEHDSDAPSGNERLRVIADACVSLHSRSNTSIHREPPEGSHYVRDQRESPNSTQGEAGFCSCVQRQWRRNPGPQDQQQSSPREESNPAGGDDRQDPRHAPASQSDDSGVSESESDSELRELMPDDQVSTIARGAEGVGGGRRFLDVTQAGDSLSHSSSSPSDQQHVKSSPSGELTRRTTDLCQNVVSPNDLRPLLSSSEELGRLLSSCRELGLTLSASGELRPLSSTSRSLQSPASPEAPNRLRVPGGSQGSVYHHHSTCDSLVSPTSPNQYGNPRDPTRSLPGRRSAAKKASPLSAKEIKMLIQTEQMKKGQKNVKGNVESNEKGRPAALIQGEQGEVTLLTTPTMDGSGKHSSSAQVFPSADKVPTPNSLTLKKNHRTSYIAATENKVSPSHKIAGKVKGDLKDTNAYVPKEYSLIHDGTRIGELSPSNTPIIVHHDTKIIGKQSGKRKYQPVPAHPDVCRRESSV